MYRSRRAVRRYRIERRERRDGLRELRRDGLFENHERTDCGLELIEELSFAGAERPRRSF